jgi:hypothetical protein
MEYYKYTPQSDFHFSIREFPFIVLEVISDPHREADRYRMLIQAAFIVRLANIILNPTTFLFVAMAIFFNETSFDRYLVYQPNISVTAVC